MKNLFPGREGGNFGSSLSVRVIVVLALILALPACDAGSTAPEFDDLGIAEIRLSAANMDLDDGDSFQLQATLIGAAGKPLAPPSSGTLRPRYQVTWTSSDPDVVTVTRAGLVLAKKEGTASVTASAGHTSSVSFARVKGGGKRSKAAKITVTPDEATLNALGSQIQVTATVLDEQGNVITNPSITWSTLDASVATVDGTGNVISKAIGVALIMATSGSAADTATLHVHQEVAAVSVSPSTATLAVGDSVRLTATATDANGVVVEGVSFTWIASDSAVAAVSGGGVVRGVGVGAATITAAAGSVSATAAIQVVSGGTAPPPSPSPQIWRMGYYPGWVQSRMPASEIDWSALTHIAHFSVLPREDGSIDTQTHVLSSANTRDLISRAHAAGVKVLLTVGSAGTRTQFLGATSDVNRATFIENIVGRMRLHGYDGLDIDWESMRESDFPQFRVFIEELSAELNKISPRPLLTAAVLQSHIYAPLFRDLQPHLDMINLMTYDMSGPWPGWVTWHNSPLYDGGYKFPNTNKTVPSADQLVKQFVAAGVDRSKLGIGIAFYGKLWTGGDGTSTGGATRPRQSWTTAPTMSSGEVKYYRIMERHYDPSRYGWDDVAKVPYLSFDNPGSSEDRFLSYENEESVAHKVRYAATERIGGLIIWEINGGYFPTRPAGSRNPLLQAIKEAL
ncbi:MAG: Ig-like domain-containing protein [Gemmatimonadetes bacterium]|nr:Ig-like domain-containing protein [Gemmatimonadota bacterium]